MSRTLMLLLLPFLPLAAAPILGPPDGSGHYQMLLSDIPDPPEKRTPTAAGMEGIDDALYDYFSVFDWFSGPIHWQVHDSNSSGAIVGSASGTPLGSWVTDFLYSGGVINSSLLDGGALRDINEAGVMVGGSANGRGCADLPEGRSAQARV